MENLENQSRRNNIKIFGVPEEENEKTWDDTEVIVKTLIRNKLGIEEHIEIEAMFTLYRIGFCSVSKVAPAPCEQE